MKTMEVIRQLLEADPSGELEVCDGNADILFIERLPAYYDGPLQVLIRKPEGAPCYDVVGARVIRAGEKVRIHFCSIEDALTESNTCEEIDNFPIEYVGMDSSDCVATDRIAEWRDRAKKLILAWKREQSPLKDDDTA